MALRLQNMKQFTTESEKRARKSCIHHMQHSGTDGAAADGTVTSLTGGSSRIVLENGECTFIKIIL